VRQIILEGFFGREHAIPVPSADDTMLVSVP
jgi:hypothetical protein